MLSIYTYHIPFKNVFKISGREYSHRDGVILLYRKKDLEAYGEIAPLPGFSSESLSQVIEVLKLNRSHIESELQADSKSNLLQVITQIHQIPSLNFGIDTLIHDLEAKRKGIPFYKQLWPDIKSNKVISNGTLSIQEIDKTLEQARDLINEGFSTLKFKVGVNFDQEKELLQKIRSEFPGIKIRIDANEAWSVSEAIQHLNELESLQIEYCEQPVSAEKAEYLKAVKEAVKIPVAADEFLRNKTSLNELSKIGAADLAVIKPMLMGDFQNIFVTNTHANTLNIKLVYTTMLESAVGRAATAAIAAGSGNDWAHGLSTGNKLAADVSPEDWLNKPEISFPDKPGLGVSLNTDMLNEV